MRSPLLTALVLAALLAVPAAAPADEQWAEDGQPEEQQQRSHLWPPQEQPEDCDQYVVESHRQRHRRHGRHVDQRPLTDHNVQPTRPYWGTMQPYWGTMQPYWRPSEPRALGGVPRARDLNSRR